MPRSGEYDVAQSLARAATPEQEAFIGNQSGGRVLLFLGALCALVFML